MKPFPKKWLGLFIYTALFLLGIVIGMQVRAQTFDPLATIPKPIAYLLSYYTNLKVEREDDYLYYDMDLVTMVQHGTFRTKAAVEGTVVEVSHEPDGDYHVIISDGKGNNLVTEFIPELPRAIPEKGDKIRIWGIVRFDIQHNWWELHPAIGWRKI